MTVYAITDTKKGEQGLRLLIFILPQFCMNLALRFHNATINISGFYQHNKSPCTENSTTYGTFRTTTRNRHIYILVRIRQKVTLHTVNKNETDDVIICVIHPVFE